MSNRQINTKEKGKLKAPDGPSAKRRRSSTLEKKPKRSNEDAETENTMQITFNMGNGFTPIPFLGRRETEENETTCIYMYAKRFVGDENDASKDDDGQDEAEDATKTKKLFFCNLPLQTSERQLSAALQLYLGERPESVVLGHERRKKTEWESVLDAEGISSSSSSSSISLSPLFSHSNPKLLMAYFRPSFTAVVTLKDPKSIRKLFSLSKKYMVQQQKSPKNPENLPIWPVFESVNDDNEDGAGSEMYEGFGKSTPVRRISLLDAHFSTRPSLSTVTNHVNDWVAEYETRPPPPLPTVQNLNKTKNNADTIDQPMHIQEDSDDDGGGEWTFVSRGGRKGRASATMADPSLYSEFTTGKMSVGVTPFREAQKLGQEYALKMEKRLEDTKSLYSNSERRQKRLDNIKQLRVRFEKDKETIRAMRKQDRTFKPY